MFSCNTLRTFGLGNYWGDGFLKSSTSFILPYIRKFFRGWELGILSSIYQFTAIQGWQALSNYCPTHVKTVVMVCRNKYISSINSMSVNETTPECEIYLKWLEGSYCRQMTVCHSITRSGSYFPLTITRIIKTNKLICSVVFTEGLRGPFTSRFNQSAQISFSDKISNRRNMQTQILTFKLFKLCIRTTSGGNAKFSNNI